MTKLHGCITTSTTKITNPTFFSTNQISLQNINHIKLKNLHFLDSKASSKYPSSASFLTNFYSPFCTSSISQTPQIQFNMSQGKDESGKLAYDAAMEALSSLITKRTRADKSNTGDRFDILFDYLKMLELEASIGKLKVIHVAGTKGKGSTCAFSESILRNCGLRTGLFTSPHLIDVRERFRLDGKDISEEKFLEYFWWCFNRLKDESSDDLPMPTYFRFLALLAFKIFVAEQVDVAILEVGLGGMYDATNVVEAPAVCGIASLGYDHMEILGNTLGQIAGEKAGIFKRGVPAFTVPQPGEAMRVLEEKASKLDVNLQVVAPLDPNLLNGLHLGLDGEHQYVNAGLAVSLCSAFLQRTGHVETSYSNKKVLPEKFVKGLNSVAFQGRAQIVRDEFMDERQGDLVFYLDGAHSPESMDVCANWFSRAIKEGYDHRCTLNNQSQTLQESDQDHHHDPLNKKSEQILLFNCMSVRDPQLLLPHLMSTCANQGVYFKKALFVPNISLYYKVGTATEPAKEAQVDISWQLTLQKVWENLIRDGKAKDQKLVDVKSEEIAIDAEKGIHNAENSSVFSSLPLAINWLRDNARRNQSTRVQVLVSGSLHLVGDVLRLVKK